MDMLGVVLIDAGLLGVLLGIISLLKPLKFLRIRNRKRALGVAGCGVAAVVLGAILPAYETRVAEIQTRLDELVPVYQFHEDHTIAVNAPKERVYAATKAVEADEIAFFRTLVWLRRFGRRGPEGILNPPQHEPILAAAMRTGFLPLADDADREIVVGLIGSTAGRGALLKPTPEDFKVLNGPGIAKVAMNFHIAQTDAGHCTLTTETRIYTTDARAKRMFATYWRVIYPGSALMRRMWLRAIKRRAEAH